MSIQAMNCTTSYAVYSGIKGSYTKNPDSSDSNAQATPREQTGDVVHISDEARAAANSSLSFLSYTTVRSFALPNGFAASLGTAQNEYGETVAKVSYTDGNGEKRNVFLDASSVLRMNEAGDMEVVAYDPGAEENSESQKPVSESGTRDPKASDLIQESTKTITGSDADELIIILPSHEDNVTWKVDANNGNNVVIDVSGDRVDIQTGDGNDTIIGVGGSWYTVDAGAGDDIIELTGKNVSNVRGGDGNDVITVNAERMGYLYGGDGDDSINLNGNVIGTLSGGAGSDSITIRGDVLGGRIYGDNPDNDSGGNDTIKIQGDIINGHIDAGNGSNSIVLESVVNTEIKTGTGNDSITVKTAISSVIEGGDGDDAFNVESLLESQLRGGNGNDSIHVGNALGGQIWGGAQKTSSSALEKSAKETDEQDLSEYEQFLADAALGVTGLEETANDGDDVIIVDGAFSTQIYGGSGNDSISVNNSRQTLIDGGAGGDSLRVNLLDRGVLLGGVGDDSMDVGYSTESEINGDNRKSSAKTGKDSHDDDKEKELSEYGRSIADAAIGLKDKNFQMNDRSEEESSLLADADISGTPIRETTETYAFHPYVSRYGSEQRTGSSVSMTI